MKASMDSPGGGVRASLRLRHAFAPSLAPMEMFHKDLDLKRTKVEQKT
jgi:hypothetical protein